MFVLSRGKAGGIAVAFNIVLDFDFTPILTFPHRGGRDNMAHINMCQQKQAGDVGLGCVDIFCHFEGREESEICEWCIRSDFRFFTPLRYVQNDRIDMRCVQNDGINMRCVRKGRVNMRCVHIDRIDILLRGEGRVVWAGGAGVGFE